MGGDIMKCDDCGKESDDVEIVVDPYAQEIDGIEVEVPLCPDCYQAKVDNI